MKIENTAIQNINGIINAQREFFASNATLIRQNRLIRRIYFLSFPINLQFKAIFLAKLLCIPKVLCYIDVQENRHRPKSRRPPMPSRQKKRPWRPRSSGLPPKNEWRTPPSTSSKPSKDWRTRTLPPRRPSTSWSIPTMHSPSSTRSSGG